MPEKDLALVEKAYEFALKAHEGQLRRSGEPYLDHPLETASIVADLQLDASSLAAALLHDVPEDCGVPLQEISDRFGHEVGRLVEGVTRLDKLAHPGEDASESQVESLRKMFVAMAEDIRVVLIKLADRMHNMRTLKPLPPKDRQRVAKETMELFVPLAHRLGIWQLEWELEDLAFRYLEAKKYHETARLVASRRAERERYIARVCRTLEDELASAGIDADVGGRPKNLYSTHIKMEKYASQGKEFSDIYDLLAVRVLVEHSQDCYSALGVLHSLWHPLPGQFDDFIATPKGNMYQSLHTVVMGPEARPLEIQIRTHEMHRRAEYGVAAHWRYKEGAKPDIGFEEKITWLRQLMEWQRELSSYAFVESLTTDIFADEVFVYTPKGDIKELPAGATPLDFAYRIHTDLGHRCVGAKVNGRLVSLDCRLHSGDTVEIVATKAERGPSRDWLNPDLGFVKTAHAREKIRQWFRKQQREENIERGRALLEKELKRLGLSLGDHKRIAAVFKFDGLDEFLVALGCGDISRRQIATQLTAPEERRRPPPAPTPHRTVAPTIEVLGVGDLLTHLATCCNPVPGDDIVGFVTRTRGVSVHRRDCPNIASEDEKERLVKVSWGKVNQHYPVPVHVEAWDRVGLLRDISAVVSEERVNISSVTSTEKDGITSINLVLEITDNRQLSRLMSKLEGVRGVTNVTRGETKRES